MIKNKFPDFYKVASLLAFLGVFFIFVFDVAISKEINPSSLKVESSLKFDKKFSGTASVIDGDSIKVADENSKKEVRLFGLDAPEYKQICFDEKNREYACGQTSYKFLLSLINGKEVVCFYTEKDKYDRYLSKCEINHTSINQEIVKNGMAIIYNYAESDEVMNQLESDARKAKIGVWRGKFQKPKEYRKEHPRKN